MPKTRASVGQLCTQAGVTFDEDFPGWAALFGPDGEIVDELPDWRAGTLAVDIQAGPGQISLKTPGAS